MATAFGHKQSPLKRDSFQDGEPFLQLLIVFSRYPKVSDIPALSIEHQQGFAYLTATRRGDTRRHASPLLDPCRYVPRHLD